MPRTRLLFSFSLLAVALLALPAAADETASVFKVGFAERDITPEIGMEQPGGYGKAYHRSIHDPCKVRAAVFDDGKTRVAIVSVDALIVRGATVAAARKGIEESCGIKPEAVLVHATHSHSSGPTGMILPGEYDHADEFVQDLAYNQSSMADAKYLVHVENQIVDAVTAANEARLDAQAGVDRGHEDQVAFNRRFFMRNGLTHTHPRQGNPDIIEPAGPTDPEVGVVGVWNKEGKLTGCIVNFVCHATTSPGGASANYIYYVEKAIRGFFGDDVVVVFLAGASGDVTQVDNLSPYQNRAGAEWAAFVGGRVGAEAVKVLLTMPRGQLTPLAAKQSFTPIKRRVPSPERVKKCYELVRKGRREVDATEWTFAKEIVLLDARLKKEPVSNVEVQAIQVGPAIFLTNPAEFFCQMGLDIKKNSPFPFTFPVSLSNHCVGYVPTKEAFGPRGGGYETRLTSYSNLEITAGPQMVEAAVKLAKSLTPGKTPERPKAPEFKGGSWTYGSVPPELD